MIFFTNRTKLDNKSPFKKGMKKISVCSTQVIPKGKLVRLLMDSF